MNGYYGTFSANATESENDSMIETAYLFSTPANREWLLESLAQADRGELVALELPIQATE